MNRDDKLRTGMIVAIGLIVLMLAYSAYAGTAFLKGEYISGMNKICLYDHLGSTVAITIRSVQLCPLTIQV